MQVVALTQDGASSRLVELVRCGECGLSGWRLDGVEVDKQTALGALTAAFAPVVPAARPDRAASQAASAAASPAAGPVRRCGAPPPNDRPELAALLAGWQVLGSAS